MVDAKVNNGKKKGSTEEEEKLQEGILAAVATTVKTIRILKFLIDKTRELVGTIHGIIILVVRLVLSASRSLVPSFSGRSRRRL